MIIDVTVAGIKKKSFKRSRPARWRVVQTANKRLLEGKQAGGLGCNSKAQAFILMIMILSALPRNRLRLPAAVDVGKRPARLLNTIS